MVPEHGHLTTGPGTATFSPDANTATATVTVSEIGTYTFTWTEVSNECSASETITVNFYQQPLANAGTGGNNCGSEFHLNAVPDVGTGTWTQTAGTGTATFTPDANDPNAYVTVSEFGEYDFTWTEVNGTCSGSDIITINFLGVPPANAGIDTSSCGPDFILNAIPNTGAISGTWAFESGPGTAVFSPTDEPDATVTVDQYGTYEFSYTEISNVCQSTDIVSVIFHELPEVSAGRDTVICEEGYYRLEAVGTGFGTLSYMWQPDTLVDDPNISNPLAFPDTSTIFRVTLTDENGCENSDEINIDVWKNPIANAGPDLVLEYLFGTPLEATEPGINETGGWSVISGSGSFADTSLAVTTVNDLALGENILLWRVTNGICLPATDYLTITIHDFVIPTLITPNGDPYNEYFVLRGLETLGTTELTIFDRRGAQVYKNSNYDNSWNGLDYNGNPLLDDTYYFVIKAENGKSISGYLVIRR